MYEKIAKQLSYSGENIKRTVRIHSDDYSKLYCNEDEAIEYATKLCNGSCLYCGEELYDVSKDNLELSSKLHLDHIYPASYGGLFTAGNIALACESCNTSKGQKDPIDYYIYKLENMERVRFEDLKSFEDYLERYTLQYRKEYKEHFKITKKALKDNELSMEQFLRVFNPEGLIQLGRRSKKRERQKKVEVKEPFSSLDLKLVEKRILLNLSMLTKSRDKIQVDVREFKKSTELGKKSNEAVVELVVAMKEKIEDEIDSPIAELFEVMDSCNEFAFKPTSAFFEVTEKLGFDEFTKREQHIYNSFKSRYTQDLYSILNIYRESNVVSMDIETFRLSLDIPKVFTLSNIDSRVIEPSIAELSKYFKEIDIRKTYGKNNRVEQINIIKKEIA